MELDSELIISEVRKYPCLYDVADLDYRDRDFKRDSWHSVTMAVAGEKWAQFSPQEKLEIGREIQRRWKSMKDSYMKSLKHREGNSGDATKPKKKYVYHKQLSFMQSIIQSQARSRSMNVSENENKPSEISDSVQEVWPLPKKRIKIDALEREIISTVRTSNECLKSIADKQTSKLDPDEMFLLSQIPVIKQLSAQKKIDFQIKFLQLLQSYTTPQESSSPAHSYLSLPQSSNASPAYEHNYCEVLQSSSRSTNNDND